jgi:hypothetical protein
MALSPPPLLNLILHYDKFHEILPKYTLQALSHLFIPASKDIIKVIVTVILFGRITYYH